MQVSLSVKKSGLKNLFLPGDDTCPKRYDLDAKTKRCWARLYLLSSTFEEAGERCSSLLDGGTRLTIHTMDEIEYLMLKHECNHSKPD